MREILKYFLSLGAFGFGGPLAVIAQIQSDLVEKRKWISESEFRGAFAMIKSMPGPVAFQMAVFMALRRGGRWAAVLAAIVYVLPSFIMMILLAEFLQHYQQVAWIESVLKGLASASFVLIALAARSLMKGHQNLLSFWILTLFCVLALQRNIAEPLVIMGAGIMEFLRWKMRPLKGTLRSWIGLDMFLICFKAGAFVFGTGLAIMPIMQRDFVDLKGWITASEFLTAISLGQITPGPVVISVVYVGYKILGVMGALIAAVGVFLPSLIHMLTWFPAALNFLQKQKWIEPVSRAVVAAVFATLLIVLFAIGQSFSLSQLALSVILGLLSLQLGLSGFSIVGIAAFIGFFL